MKLNTISEKIKILYLINSFTSGGAEEAMVRIVSRLNKDKYNIKVVALKEDSGKILPKLKKENIETINLEIKNKLDFKAIPRLLKLLKSEKPDILWCSLFHATILGRIIGKLARIPIIINWEHNERFYGFHRAFINKITSSFSGVIIADSKKVASQLLNKLKISSKKIKVISIGGLDFNQYYKVNNKKEKLKCIVGSVGSLSNQKGYPYLVEAAEIVIKKYPKTEFIIAGDGPDREKLERLVLKANLTNNFKLLGYQSNIPEILSKIDIYVQPSIWEGLCMTVIEAMAAKLPVVASNVGGIPESVIEGKTGFLVPPKNPQILAQKIIYLIKNSNLKGKMGKEGRKITEEKYSVDKMMAKIENLIDNLIKEKLL